MLYQACRIYNILSSLLLKEDENIQIKLTIVYGCIFFTLYFEGKFSVENVINLVELGSATTEALAIEEQI